MCAASVVAFATILSMHMTMAVPPSAVRAAAVRVAAVMRDAVSPCSTTTSSMGTPSRSAAICAKLVSWPCPCGVAPVITVTLPEISMRTQPHSQPPAAIAFDGPIAQIST